MTVTTSDARITIPVTGMHCAACQARVQKVLNGTAGVHDASVNLMTNSAVVRFDPAVIDPPALVERIRTTGYGRVPFWATFVLAITLRMLAMPQAVDGVALPMAAHSLCGSNALIKQK